MAKELEFIDLDNEDFDDFDDFDALEKNEETEASDKASETVENGASDKEEMNDPDLDDFDFDDDALDEINEASEDELDDTENEETDDVDNNNTEEETDDYDYEVSNDKEEEFDSKETEIVNEDEENTDSENYVLYILTDKVNKLVLKYFRDLGIKVTKVFTNITDAKDNLMMQVDPIKLVVMETGTGRFAGMIARKELADLVGLCDGESKVFIFYTDSAIKGSIVEATTMNSKNFTWFKYKSTANVVANLYQLNELNDIGYDEDDKDTYREWENPLDFKGISREYNKSIDLGEPLITPQVVSRLVSDTDETNSIPGYDIKY